MEIYDLKTLSDITAFIAHAKKVIEVCDPTGSRTQLPRLKILCPN